MPVPASIRRGRPEARAAWISCAMRICWGRDSKDGRTRARGPVAPRIRATSAPTSIHPRHEAPQLLETLFNLGGVGGLRRDREVALEIGHRLGDQGEPEVDQPPV